jgi:hypothetical protein
MPDNRNFDVGFRLAQVPSGTRPPVAEEKKDATLNDIKAMEDRRMERDFRVLNDIKAMEDRRMELDFRKQPELEELRKQVQGLEERLRLLGGIGPNVRGQAVGVLRRD